MSVCVCVCVCEREREREREVTGSVCVCACVCVCVCERERQRGDWLCVCVCVCVCVCIYIYIVLMNFCFPQLDQGFPLFSVDLQQVLNQYVFLCFTACFICKPPSFIKISYQCSLQNIKLKILPEFSNSPLNHVQTLHTSHHLIFYHFPTFNPAFSLPLP